MIMIALWLLRKKLPKIPDFNVSEYSKLHELTDQVEKAWLSLPRVHRALDKKAKQAAEPQ